MRRHSLMASTAEAYSGGGRPPDTAADTAPTESQIRDAELYRMAAFRIRETANRIATLANNARDQTLRAELTTVYDRLIEEERALLTRAGDAGR